MTNIEDKFGMSADELREILEITDKYSSLVVVKIKNEKGLTGAVITHPDNINATRTQMSEYNISETDVTPLKDILGVDCIIFLPGEIKID